MTGQRRIIALMTIAGPFVGAVLSGLWMRSWESGRAGVFTYGVTAAALCAACAIAFMLLVWAACWLCRFVPSLFLLFLAFHLVLVVAIAVFAFRTGDNLAMVAAIFGPIYMMPATVTTQWLMYWLLWRERAELMLVGGSSENSHRSIP